MDNKKLCLDLIHAEHDEDVVTILKKVNLWENRSCWRDFGDNENNWSIIGNQKCSADNALTEKIINSIDAILIKECMLKGINPESNEAPQSISDAQKKFFNIPEGKLSSMTTFQRDKLSNIMVVATGSKLKPCISIIDFGEGQTPDKMPDTFLSLIKSNKVRIPFVQGKYNMGGTGIIRFCSPDKNYLQLILSKRCPDIHEEDPSKEYWGFTIVRREYPEKGFKSSICRYLCLNGKILRFTSDYLPILPGEYPLAYDKQMMYGSYIKLYEYDINKYRTTITLDLYNRIAYLLPGIALPIKMYERREGYQSHTHHTVMSGLSVRLDEDKRENLESNFPTFDKIIVDNQQITVTTYAFKKKGDKRARDSYSNNDAIIFCVNGQVHGSLSHDFFTRSKVGMDYLKKDILIVVDCSYLDPRTIENLFLNSRDRLQEGEVKSEIEKRLEEILSKHPGLRELRQKRINEDVGEKLKESKPLVDLIEKVIANSPTLSSLLISGNRISNPLHMINSSSQVVFEGKRFPDFFTITRNFPKISPKECPINQRFRIQFSTNATNDYFGRDDEPGRIAIKANNIQLKDNEFAHNMWNGICNLNVILPPQIEVDDLIEYEVEVTDENRAIPFTNTFFIKVAPYEDKNDGKIGKRRDASNDHDGKGQFRKSKLGIPNIIKVNRDDNNWVEFNFNEDTGLHVVNNGNDGEYDYFINMSNKYLINEIKNKRNVDERILRDRYQISLVLIGMSIIGQSTRNDDGKNTRNIAEDVGYFTKCISPFILPIISDLGSLDVSEEYGDQ